MDFCFVLDIVFNFRTAVLTREYELIYEPDQIAKRYIRSGWFVIDVAASFPMDYFFALWEHRAFLQINRLLRISRLWKKQDYVTNLERSVTTTAAWKRMFLDFRALFFVAHWVGCIWWAIGYLEYE